MTSLQARIGPVDLALTERAGHATQLASRAVAEGRTLVISVGGDGVLSEVVNGLLARPGASDAACPPVAASPTPEELPALGIVSAGTGGDFGRSLDIAPAREPYVEAIAGGRTRVVDVGRARFVGNDGRPVERFFVNVLSAGIGGLVDRYTAAMPAAIPGRAAYGAATIGAVVTCRRRRILCRATLADGATLERVLTTYAVVIANGHTFGGGMKVAPAARVDDGLLDVILVETPTKLTMLRHFLSIYRGEHLTKPGVSAFACTKVELRAADGGQSGAALLPPRRRRGRARRPPTDGRGQSRAPARARLTTQPRRSGGRDAAADGGAPSAGLALSAWARPSAAVRLACPSRARSGRG